MRLFLFCILVGTLCMCHAHNSYAGWGNSEECNGFGNCNDDHSVNADADVRSSGNSSNIITFEPVMFDLEAEVDLSNHNRNSNFGVNAQRQKMNQSQTGLNLQGGQSATTGSQAISIFNPSDDVKGAAKEMVKHAAPAPDAEGMSSDGTTPCGDQTGLSAQTGVLGGGLATVSESCRAYRLQQLQKNGEDSVSTTLAAITHYVGWLPRTILHVATLGVLN